MAREGFMLIRRQSPKACSDEAPPRRASSRCVLRASAGAANCAMVLYVYLSHLWGAVSMERLGVGASAQDSPPSAGRGGDVMDRLKLFSFSEAMLANLGVYVLIGAPVALAYHKLERDRIRWLKALVHAHLPTSQANRAQQWLGWYWCSVNVTLLHVLLLAPLHLERPIFHYLCAGMAFGSGFLSVLITLMLPVPYADLARNSGDPALARWAHQVEHVVHPTLKCVCALHVLAGLAALLKLGFIGSARASLIFGLCETSVILGYQCYQGIFIVDDIMVSRSFLPRFDGKKGTISSAACALPRWHTLQHGA